MESYAATATNRASVEQNVSGTITVDAQNFVFRGENDVEIVIPHSRLIVTGIGAAQWQFHDSETDDWSVETSDKRILANYYFTYRHNIRKQVREISAHQEGLRRLWLAPAFLIIFFALLGTVWLISNRSVHLLVARIPLSWERNLSEDLIKRLESDGEVQTGTQETVYLESLGNRLMPVESKTKYRLRFYILNHPDMNAVAFPGGVVVVTSGTLASMRKPEQLAGILAHEIAHVLERHSLRKLVSSVGPSYALRLFIRDKSSFLSVLAHSSHILLRQNFSREYELEADKTAWKLLVDARIDPRGFIEALRDLQADQSRIFPTDKTPQLLSSHPPTEERIKRLESFWSKTFPKSGFIGL